MIKLFNWGALFLLNIIKFPAEAGDIVKERICSIRH